MRQRIATYRLQFRQGVTFEAAARQVPYLVDLGVSHIYASPIFKAVPGSAHGYDVVDPGELDPDLGGWAAFDLLAATLRDHDLGLLLDIVPNHMAASTTNPWWTDVLRHGRDSTFAHYFDIDWSRPKLLLPLLGEPYGEALAEDRFELRIDPGSGEVCFSYYDHCLPLSPESSETLRSSALSLEQVVAKTNDDRAELHRIHETQHWRLAYWRLAREALGYRRFFEISELIGLRVEDASVFAAVHRLPLQLVKEGVVDGLRIDHVDGLADPKTYLDRLGQASRLDWIIVEKILGDDETLPADWIAVGTTGYEVGQQITALQVDGRNEEPLTAAWSAFTGDDPDFDSQVLNAKRRILTRNLAGELDVLVDLAYRIAAGDLATRDFGRDALRRALVELAASLPVYRTYIGPDGPSERDVRLVRDAIRRIDNDREVEDKRLTAFIGSLLMDSTGGSQERLEFIQRFQQTTGPLMAKAVEDTVFYRYNRLIALNEVGANPATFGLEPGDLHAAMTRRAAISPYALSATATHDTKRGEDARARLAVISEVPDEWAEAVERWHHMSEHLRTDVEHGPAPGPHAEWLFYQAVAGAWPPDISIDDAEALADLCERLVAFMTKALREAKRRTSWTDQNERFEEAVENYVRMLFAPANRTLLANIRKTIARLEPAGIINSLAQATLKLTLPGIPDIYQGAELLDFSMVDPDNRRPVDFMRAGHLLCEVRDLPAREALSGWRVGLPKLWLFDRLLALRHRLADHFAHADYAPLRVVGERREHVVAFVRASHDRQVVVVVPRLVYRLMAEGGLPMVDVTQFEKTAIALPPGEGGWSALGGVIGAPSDGPIAVSRLWSELPVSVLWR